MPFLKWTKTKLGQKDEKMDDDAQSDIDRLYMLGKEGR